MFCTGVKSEGLGYPIKGDGEVGEGLYWKWKGCDGGWEVWCGGGCRMWCVCYLGCGRQWVWLVVCGRIRSVGCGKMRL